MTTLLRANAQTLFNFYDKYMTPYMDDIEHLMLIHTIQSLQAELDEGATHVDVTHTFREDYFDIAARAIEYFNNERLGPVRGESDVRFPHPSTIKKIREILNLDAFLLAKVAIPLWHKGNAMIQEALDKRKNFVMTQILPAEMERTMAQCELSLLDEQRKALQFTLDKSSVDYQAWLDETANPLPDLHEAFMAKLTRRLEAIGGNTELYAQKKKALDVATEHYFKISDGLKEYVEDLYAAEKRVKAMLKHPATFALTMNSFDVLPKETLMALAPLSPHFNEISLAGDNTLSHYAREHHLDRVLDMMPGLPDQYDVHSYARNARGETSTDMGKLRRAIQTAVDGYRTRFCGWRLYFKANYRFLLKLLDTQNFLIMKGIAPVLFAQGGWEPGSMKNLLVEALKSESILPANFVVHDGTGSHNEQANAQALAHEFQLPSGDDTWLGTNHGRYKPRKVASMIMDKLRRAIQTAVDKYRTRFCSLRLRFKANYRFLLELLDTQNRLMMEDIAPVLFAQGGWGPGSMKHTIVKALKAESILPKDFKVRDGTQANHEWTNTQAFASMFQCGQSNPWLKHNQGRHTPSTVALAIGNMFTYREPPPAEPGDTAVTMG
jgi:hypothetical protein